LAVIGNEQIRNQMLTPAALHHILPTGLLGAFAGFILFAFLSTHTSYMLAWGGILIQDVIIPIRGRKLEPKEHMLWIRLSIVFVAFFIICFSTFFQQNENLYMFLDLTGGLYLTGAGIVLLGGLYWKRGTTPAAWASIIVGAVLSLAGFIVRSKYDTFCRESGQSVSFYVVLCIAVAILVLAAINLFKRRLLFTMFLVLVSLLLTFLAFWFRDSFPNVLDGRLISFYVTMIAVVSFFIVSEITREPSIDLNEIMNRRKEEVEARKSLRWYQFASEVPKGDRILIPFLYGSIFIFVTAFIAAWIYCNFVDVPLEFWAKFWKYYVYSMFWIGAAFMVWVITGGFRNIFQLFRNLHSQAEDTTDDGSVTGHHASGTEQSLS
jgi:SSS family solute:Na+ symporter